MTRSKLRLIRITSEVGLPPRVLGRPSMFRRIPRSSKKGTMQGHPQGQLASPKNMLKFTGLFVAFNMLRRPFATLV